MQYPQPIADEVVELYTKLTKSREVADIVGVSHCTVIRMVREQRKTVRRRGRPGNPDRDPVVRRRAH